MSTHFYYRIKFKKEYFKKFERRKSGARFSGSADDEQHLVLELTRRLYFRPKFWSNLIILQDHALNV